MKNKLKSLVVALKCQGETNEQRAEIMRYPYFPSRLSGSLCQDRWLVVTCLLASLLWFIVNMILAAITARC